jgi:uncharacterized protein YggE
VLLIAGSVAAAMAVAGGVAGGVAAVVSRASTPSPTGAGAGATLFFPASGGNAPSDGSLGAAQGAPSGGGGVAAMPAIATQDKAASFAGPIAAYPYPSCGGGTPTTQVQSDGVTATAMVQIPLSSATANATTTLNIGVQANDSDVKTALADARARLDAIRTALHNAGVPDSQITTQNLNAWANGNPKPVNSNVNGGLTATLTDASLIDRALTAAINAGATNVNLWTSGGTSAATPTDDQLHSALAKATSEAHSMASAEAQGAGLSLGSVRAITSQAPSLCPWATGGPQLVVTVTVTYAVK